MTTELRNTAAEAASETSWVTHGCLFYETPQDLFETVIPFFQAGLEGGECCVWITSERVTERAATDALRRAIPDLDRHFENRSIELIPHTHWFLESGAFHPRRVLERFQDQLRKARDNGYAGLRMTGDCGWLKSDDRAAFRRHENEINGRIAGKPVMILCTYPIAAVGGSELLEIARAHPVTVSVRNGDWEVIDSPELKEAKAEIKKLNQVFEGKVVERTRSLRAAIEELRSEIEERKHVEAELRQQKEVLQKVFDHIPVMIVFISSGGRIEIVNREWEKTLGWTLKEIQARRLDIVAECYPDAREQKRVWDFISRSDGQWTEFRTRLRDGRVIDTSWANIHLSDGTSIGFGRDVTERKRALGQLEETTQQLRTLSASIEAAREQERARVARLIHDELGSTFTSLKWDLEGLERSLAQAPDTSTPEALQLRVAAMTRLVDSTIKTVRRVAWELRPSMLDDLGLMEAIESQAQQFEARTGVVCKRRGFFHFESSERQSTEIFRIFQEALTNILRHAKATRVEIAMAQEAGEFVLTIGDNGRGFTGIETSGLGILGMQERARLVGGKIDIHGVAGAGTTITVRVPIAGKDP